MACGEHPIVKKSLREVKLAGEQCKASDLLTVLQPKRPPICSSCILPSLLDLYNGRWSIPMLLRWTRLALRLLLDPCIAALESAKEVSSIRDGNVRRILTFSYLSFSLLQSRPASPSHRAAPLSSKLVRLQPHHQALYGVRGNATTLSQGIFNVSEAFHREISS